MKLSIHFGINKYYSSYYGNTPNLSGCCNDAAYMSTLAKSHGFSGDKYLDEVCTKAMFERKMSDAAKLLQPGDILLFSQSSHGTFDEKNGKRITGLCFHDGILWDYEIKQILSKFMQGVLIVWICDSCFSENNFKFFKQIEGQIKFTKTDKKAAPFIAKEIIANVIAISSSNQFQPSYDLGKGGLFTTCLKKAVELMPNLNYYKTYKEILKQVAKSGYPQTPMFEINAGDKTSFTYQIFLN